MEYKEHKKMYKAGKKWAVAALVSASVLMGGALNAHADHAAFNNTENYNETSTVNTDDHHAVTQAGASDVTSSTAKHDDTTVPASQNTNNDTKTVDNNDSQSVASNDKANNNVQTQLKQSGNETSKAAQNNLKKLNPAAAQAVKNRRL